VRPRALSMALTVTLALAACSFGGDAADRVSGGEDGGAVPVAAEQEQRYADESGGGDLVLPSDRLVIRTAELALRASDTRETYDRITALVEAAGGYVAQADIQPSQDDTPPVILMVVRVPAEGLGSAIAAIRATADEVVSESISSQDVTEEFIDIDARLRNLRSLEAELVALLGTVRVQPDASPEELLRVYQEIANTRGEIEQLEGRREALGRLVALSTVTVSILPAPAAVPIVAEEWRPDEIARDAVRALVSALQAIAAGLIWAAIYVLPVLVLAGIPLLAVGWWWRRRARRRSAMSPPPPPPSPQA
jgi:hypothetical protein